MSVKDISKIQDDTEQINSMIITLWKDCGYTFSSNQIEKDWLKRSRKIDNLTGYYRSIINSLQFGVYLKQNSGKADDILTSLVIGASSKGGNSSDFIKVY